MSDEVHHFHHSDARLTIDLDVTHTTRGDTWEIDVKGAAGPDEAIAAFVQTRDRLLPTLQTEATATVKIELPQTGQNGDVQKDPVGKPAKAKKEPPEASPA
jgi:hypothetical protein